MIYYIKYYKLESPYHKAGCNVTPKNGSFQLKKYFSRLQNN